VKVLITGARGQLGQSLLRSAPVGHEVHAAGREELDITNETSVRAITQAVRPDVIVNAAAYTAVDRAEADEVTCLKVNADGPRWLAQSARECGARLLQISTDFVFDGKASAPYLPQAECRPLSAYGRSKRAGEQAVLETLGERTVVLRTAWVYAAWGSNFVRTMLRLMAERRSVRVVSDQVGSPTSASSVADVLWRLIGRADIHGIHHWTDGGTASWYDFAVAIAAEGTAMKLLPPAIEVVPITTADYPTPARRPAYSVLDTQSTRALLGLHQEPWRTNLRAVLREIAHA
jgi:dTDP-4-dehydrorhamnose reductase